MCYQRLEGAVETMNEPTFESTRRDSYNGRVAICQVIKGRSFAMRAARSRTRAWMDFDMHCGNHDIRDEVSESLAERYESYLRSERLRPTRYTTFTHKVISLQVRKEDAEGWFSHVFELLSNLANLDRIRVFEFDGVGEYRLPKGLLRTVARLEDGEVVETDQDAFTRFVEDLILDYRRLTVISPRDFEQAIAAVYARTARFDRVILTPRSGDGGRDVILEAAEWCGKRVIVETKRYRQRRISAEMVNSLIGVLTGEADGSMAAFLTTSRFAPRLKCHRSICKALASKSLQLLDLIAIIEGCIQTEYSPDPDHFVPALGQTGKAKPQPLISAK